VWRGTIDEGIYDSFKDIKALQRRHNVFGDFKRLSFQNSQTFAQIVLPSWSGCLAGREIECVVNNGPRVCLADRGALVRSQRRASRAPSLAG
jgi:hypothetical protein